MALTAISSPPARCADYHRPYACPASAALGFNGAAYAAQRVAQMSAISPGDIGTTKPLGVYDPLGLMTKMPDKYRRWQEMEIKHGRMAQLAVHPPYRAGVRWPGYLSLAEDIKFSDMQSGTIASWEARNLGADRARRRAARQLDPAAGPEQGPG